MAKLSLQNGQWRAVVFCKEKVKESRNRPGVAQRVPGGLRFQISWHSAHEGGEVVSLTHRPPLLPGNVPGTHFHKGLTRPQDHGAVRRNVSQNNPVTRPEIDPGTIRLVAQSLNHYATPGSLSYFVLIYNWKEHNNKVWNRNIKGPKPWRKDKQENVYDSIW